MSGLLVWEKDWKPSEPPAMPQALARDLLADVREALSLLEGPRIVTYRILKRLEATLEREGRAG